MRIARFSSALALACVSLAACGAPKVAPAVEPASAKAPESAVSRFFPLIDGTQWAYDAEEDDTGQKGLFVTRARAMAGPRFSLVTGQRSRIVEVRAEGITRVETGTYLLRAPLDAGAEWPGDGGAMVRVAAMDRIVDVPAGKFVGCLDTVEEQRGAGGEPVRRVTTTYCPEVGIVSLHAEAWENGRHIGERAVLRSFGKPISILKN
ncbi:MAG TPA: hypothetical protein VK550_33500 [Polyangiaceae bacterium]|nr:hypothetical protein [Polyangiaceae bacterium]